MLAGCATLVAPGPDLVSVNSSPPGARVLLNGAPVGTTPMLLPVKRTLRDPVVRLEADGLPPRDVELRRVTNGWVLGNVLFGGIPGFVVDLLASNGSKLASSERIDEDLTRPTTRPTAESKPATKSDGYHALEG